MSKPQALKTFQKLSPSDELLEKILESIKLWSTQEDWTKEKGKYIPYPSSWLNSQGWENKPVEQQQASQPNQDRIKWDHSSLLK